MEHSKVVLRAESVSADRGPRRVLDRVNLRVAAGEIVAVLGPNGAGKTTLFEVVVGMHPGAGGRIWVGEQDVTRLPAHRRVRHGLGYLPQEPSIFRELTVRENLQAYLRDDVASADLDRWLERCSLGPLAATRGDRLSGGERRRVELARCLAARPDVVVLDEPFAGLDPRSVERLERQLQDLGRQGIGILFSDHAASRALRLCRTACLLVEGRVAVRGPAAVVEQSPALAQTYLASEDHPPSVARPGTSRS